MQPTEEVAPIAAPVLGPVAGIVAPAPAPGEDAALSDDEEFPELGFLLNGGIDVTIANETRYHGMFSREPRLYRDHPKPPYDGLQRERWPYDYEKALGMSYKFYEAQRSGPISTAPGGNRVGWRLDQLLTDAVTIGGHTYDLTGGNYEAGNRLKVTLAQAYYSARLAWSCVYHREIYEDLSFEGRSMMYWCKREVRWSAEYLLKTHLRAPGAERTHLWDDADRLVVMVGDMSDFPCYRRAEHIPDQMDCRLRPVYLANATRPAAESAAESAASLALSGALLQDDDAPFAAECMRVAHVLYDFANKHRQLAADNFLQVQRTYPASHVHQYLLWASVSLAFAHRCDRPAPACSLRDADQYLLKALDLWQSDAMRGRYSFFVSNWDNPSFDAALALAMTTGEVYETWGSLMDIVVQGYVGADGTALTQSPKGLRLHSTQTWSTLRMATFGAFMGATFAHQPIDPVLRMQGNCLARSQIGYVLGDTGRSYVVGFDATAPRQVHHRDASCTLREDLEGRFVCRDHFASARDNPYVLFGAVVGGPNKTDQYRDSRIDYHYSEVALDYNTGLTIGLAALISAPADLWTADCARYVDYPVWP